MTYNSISHIHDTPINKGFFDIHDNFTQCGWKINNNTENMLSYVKPVYYLDEFIITIDSHKINVIIPIPDCDYSYKTYFKSYFEASEYIISRLYDYEQIQKK